MWVWEKEMLGECQALLHDFVMQAQVPDMWLWRQDSTSGYSVRGAYQLLTSQPPYSLDTTTDLIWQKQ
ncbi:heat-shock protein, partial [Trifolium medium]|nr:heat-shock protein [Trifolium medium]